MAEILDGFSTSESLTVCLSTSELDLHSPQHWTWGQDKTRRSGVVKWNHRRSWYSNILKGVQDYFSSLIKICSKPKKPGYTLREVFTAQLRSVGEPRRFHSNPPNILVARMLSRNCHRKGICVDWSLREDVQSVGMLRGVFDEIHVQCW